jgi:hypothetical protein
MQYCITTLQAFRMLSLPAWIECQKPQRESPMSNAVRSPHANPFRTKHLVFVLIPAMAVYVLYHCERFLIESTNPVWQH